MSTDLYQTKTRFYKIFTYYYYTQISAVSVQLAVFSLEKRWTRQGRKKMLVELLPFQVLRQQSWWTRFAYIYNMGKRQTWILLQNILFNATLYYYFLQSVQSLPVRTSLGEGEQYVHYGPTVRNPNGHYCIPIG